MLTQLNVEVDPWAYAGKEECYTAARRSMQERSPTADLK